VSNIFCHRCQLSPELWRIAPYKPYLCSSPARIPAITMHTKFQPQLHFISEILLAPKKNKKGHEFIRIENMGDSENNSVGFKFMKIFFQKKKLLHIFYRHELSLINFGTIQMSIFMYWTKS
jgi:hypothetical protein